MRTEEDTSENVDIALLPQHAIFRNLTDSYVLLIVQSQRLKAPYGVVPSVPTLP